MVTRQTRIGVSIAVRIFETPMLGEGVGDLRGLGNTDESQNRDKHMHVEIELTLIEMITTKNDQDPKSSQVSIWSVLVDSQKTSTAVTASLR